MTSHFYFSTLGYKENPLLQKYQDAFIQKLESFWGTFMAQSIPSREFLLSPDIHSLLIAGMQESESTTRDYYKDILNEEISCYGSKQSILFNQIQDLIPGTLIGLTQRFYNPDAQFDAHPDHQKGGSGISFGDTPESEWKELIAKAFDIIREVSPGFMMEIDTTLRKIIPMNTSHGVHNSGSYGNAIGQIYMSYPLHIESPEIAIVEAILHEYNHNKLNLILQTEPLLLNDGRETYYSPYRPDARHLHGIYLGLHAMTGAFWTIWSAYAKGTLKLPRSWLEKSLLYVLKNGISLQILDSYGKPSPIGAIILEEMRGVHKECLQIIKSTHLPKEVIRNAQENLMKHHIMVRKNFPFLIG